MDCISKIPYLFSLVTALIAVLISIFQRKSFQNICMRTSVILVVFYCIGFIVEKCIEHILNEEDKRKLSMEDEQQQEQQQQKEKHQKEGREEDEYQKEKEHVEPVQYEEEGFSAMEYERVDKSRVKNH